MHCSLRSIVLQTCLAIINFLSASYLEPDPSREWLHHLLLGHEFVFDIYEKYYSIVLHKYHAVTAFKGQKSKYDSDDSKNEVAESAEQISGDKGGEARPRGKQSKAEAEIPED